MGRVSDAKERLMEAVSELIWSGSYGSTTIDHICEKAGVKKGSFYYFFDSKSDLAAVAFEAEWQKHRPVLDSLFSPTVPPLKRLKNYCDYGYRFQAEIAEKHGRVLGCPLCSLGSEVSTQEDRLQKKVQEIMEYKQRYLESVIRDANAAGLTHIKDVPGTAFRLFAYYQGLNSQARIRNDLNVLKDAMQGTYDLLGVPESALLPA